MRPAPHHAVVFPVEAIDLGGVQNPKIPARAGPGNSVNLPSNRHTGGGDGLTGGHDSRISNTAAGLLEGLGGAGDRHGDEQQGAQVETSTLYNVGTIASRNSWMMAASSSPAYSTVGRRRHSRIFGSCPLFDALARGNRSNLDGFDLPRREFLGSMQHSGNCADRNGAVRSDFGQPHMPRFEAEFRGV